MDSSPVLLAGDIAVTAGAIGSTLFVAVYALTAPWWRSLVGWSVMLLTVALAAATGLVTASRWWGTGWPARDWIRFGLFAGIGCAVWGLLITLLVSQVFRPRSSHDNASAGRRRHGR